MSLKLILFVTTFFIFPAFYSNASTGEQNKNKVFIEVKRGSSLHQVAYLLKKEELISNVFYFKFIAWWRGHTRSIQSGEYIFQKGMSPHAILEILVKGETQLYHITFPEGYNIYEMALALEKEKFLKQEDFISLCHNSLLVNELLGKNRESLEGYLFPDTYYIPRPVKPEVLIRQMVQNFFKVYHQVSDNEQQKIKVNSRYLSRHELVTLASIVEKETGKAEERPLIASVFYNRLKKNIRLESDPTILYGMMKEAGGLVTLNIRKKDILRKTPYNTYKISGFPAGPISNPGKHALQSVFKPDTSPFFYFVSRNDGSHVFSRTYEEHKKAVNYYQKKQR